MTQINTVLLLSDGVSYGEYRALKKHFSKLDNWNFIFITNETILRIYNYLSIDTKQLKLFEQNLKKFKLQQEFYSGNFDFIFKNEYFNFQFNGILDELKDSQVLEFAFKFLLDYINPQIIIFGHDAFTKERILVNASKEKNILTIGLLHSGLGFKYGYRGIVGDVDYVLVWNNIDKDFISDFGISKDRIIVIGSLRFDKYYNKHLKNINRNLKNTSTTKKKILLLTAAINTGLSAPIASQTLHLKFIFELIDLIIKRKDFVFLIKPHPSFDHYELYRQLRELKLPNLIFDETISLDEAINNTDICLMLNYFTTASIEAMLNNIPVIFFNNAVFPMHYWITNDTNNYILRVGNITDLEFKIDEILTNDVYRREILFKSDFLLKNILRDTGKTTHVNFNDFLSNKIFPYIGSSRKNIFKIDNDYTSNYIINPAFLFLYGTKKNIFIRNVFNCKILRINKKINDYNFSTLLKYYITGSNSSLSIESTTSLLYLLKLFFMNVDLFFINKHYKNKLLHIFLIKQISRNQL